MEDGNRLQLPPEWSVNLDPATGKTYYFHAKTAASRWNPPYYFTLAEEEKMRVCALKFSVVSMCPGDYPLFSVSDIALMEQVT